MKFLSMFLICNLMSIVAISQVAKDIELNPVLDTIPFKLSQHNNIIVKSILNKKDTLDLMFHTAAGSISIIKEIASSLKSITWSEADTIESWGGRSETRFSESNKLEIWGTEFDSIPIWECLHSGKLTDGKFGPNLFSEKIIEINFDAELMILHERIPETENQFSKLNLIVENGSLFLEGKSYIKGDVLLNKYLIHSGYSGTILLDDKFVNENHAIQTLDIISESGLKDSFGNVIKVKKASLPKFEIGDIPFDEIPVGFFEGAIGRQKMSLIGADVIKRFNIILDIKGQQIYLHPNDNFNLPFSNS